MDDEVLYLILGKHQRPVFSWFGTCCKTPFRPLYSAYTRNPGYRLIPVGTSTKEMAGAAGLEPVTSAVTGQRSNQLSYAPALLGPQNYEMNIQPSSVSRK